MRGRCTSKGNFITVTFERCSYADDLEGDVPEMELDALNAIQNRVSSKAGGGRRTKRGFSDDESGLIHLSSPRISREEKARVVHGLSSENPHE